MGLTVNFQRPNVRDITAPKAPISGDQIESLGKGIGSFYRWNERQKAADMMEGKSKAQARIAEIDTEIAELEAQLAKIDQGKASFANALEQRDIDAMNRADAQLGMAGYQPNSVLSNPAQPENITSVPGEQYLATPKFDRSNSQYAKKLVEDQYAYDQLADARSQMARNKYRWRF